MGHHQGSMSCVWVSRSGLLQQTDTVSSMLVMEMSDVFYLTGKVYDEREDAMSNSVMRYNGIEVLWYS